jgi:predicted ribosomally synthesized peptide with SipW-like signal peptide
MKKIMISIMTIGIAALFLGAGTISYFSDPEKVTGNVFTAGIIDISLNPSSGQDVVTVEGDLFLKPCQVGYTETLITNVGNNPCEVWKHIDNVQNFENGKVEPEREYYTANPGSDLWLISDWIHYDMSICRSLDYSYTQTISMLGKDDQTYYDLEVTVEDGDGWQTWTFDFPVELWTGDGQINAALIIATDGDGNGPAYQIHNNDGATTDYPAGTWLMSPWGPTIGDGWFGWHSGTDNTPVSELDWVQASGQRKAQGTDGILEIKIKKCSLSATTHWAAWPTVGSGWWEIAATYMPIPDADTVMGEPEDFDWGSPIVDMSIPNYIEADIHSGVSIEIAESDGWFLTSTGPYKPPENPEWGVECKWIYLGILEPGESMLVIQSYHLDVRVDNWGQSDKVTFDMEFMAQQIEGALPPAPGPVLPGHGR